MEENQSQEQTSTESSVGSWDNYINNFLKASDVSSEGQAFVVVSIEEVINDSEKSIRLHLESNETKYLFDLNKTNTVYLKDNGIAHPKDVVGKKLYFKKVATQNPRTHQEVEGLRIRKIESVN